MPVGPFKFTHNIAWPPISTINSGINILKPTETRLNLHLNQYDLVRVDQNFLCKYKAMILWINNCGYVLSFKCAMIQPKL